MCYELIHLGIIELNRTDLHFKRSHGIAITFKVESPVIH